MFGLHWLDLVVIALYFLFMAGIGVYAYRRVKSQGDFFLGGRRFGKGMMIMFMFGTGTHADTAAIVAAKSYSLGLAGIWYQWQQLFITAFYWLLAPVFRRARCVTTAEFFERRYGTGFAVLYTVYGVFISVGALGVMLFGSGRMIEALTGGEIPLFWAFAIMIACFTVYGVAGGLVAAVWTDFFQGILTIVMSFLLLPFMWQAVGGRAGLRAAIPNVEEALSLSAGEIGLLWIVMNALNALVRIVAEPNLMANAGAGKTELEGRVGFVFGILIKRVCTVAWALVGVLAMALYAGSGLEGDHVFGQAVRDHLPVGLVGLMVACVMASVMSTCDVLMISSAALLTRNVYARFVAPGGDERHMMRVARLISVGFVAAGVLLATQFEDLPQAMHYMWKTGPLIGIPFFMAIWWRRANRVGAWGSFLCALAAMLLGEFYEPLGLSGQAALPYHMMFYLGAGVLGGILFSLLAPREDAQRLDDFYLTINTPIGQEHVLTDRGVRVIMN